MINIKIRDIETFLNVRNVGTMTIAIFSNAIKLDASKESCTRPGTTFKRFLLST
jgi:hypothetical protein